jgi:hypothetical protein
MYFKFICFVYKKVRANANKGSCNWSSR